MLIQCSLARGDLDNARSQLNRLENLLGNGKYHSDWISNANKVRVIYWQMTGDKAAAANWLRHTAKPDLRTTTSCKVNGATLPVHKSCWASLNRQKLFSKNSMKMPESAVDERSQP